MYHFEEDHEAIIDFETWEAAQLEAKRKAQYCTDHQTNAYSQKSEVNPFYRKITCGHSYTRIKYNGHKGRTVIKWRCSSCNMTDGHKICTNHYVKYASSMKLFMLCWNEIVVYPVDYRKI